MAWEPKWRAQARATFAQRFEADGEGYHFRGKPTAHPVRVSKAEYEAALSAFLRGQLILMALLVGGILLGVIGLVASEPLADTDRGGGDWRMWALIGVAIAAFSVGWMYLWRAPDRLWRDRAPAGAARDKKEAVRQQMARTSWLQLAVIAGGGALLAGSHLLDSEGAERWGWGGLMLLVLGAAAWGAWRKWHSERAG